MDNTNTKIVPSLHDRFAAWVLDHRRGFLAVVTILLITVVVWGAYQVWQGQQDNQKLDKIYAFQSKNMKAWEEGTITAQDLAAAFQDLRQEVGPFVGLYPFALALSDELLSKGATNEVATILEDAMKNYVKGNNYRRYLVATRLAAAYEDLGQTQKAIDVLQSLDAAHTKLLPDKVKLDLGRLYRTIDPAKAKTYLQAVVENSQVAEFSRIAKLYLQSLEGAVPSAQK